MKINETNSNAIHQIDKGSLLSLSLYVNGQSRQVMVRIIDNKSKETIRDTSSQELQDIHDQIYDLAGRLLNEEQNI